jgi:hypothetical protein
MTNKKFAVQLKDLNKMHEKFTSLLQDLRIAVSYLLLENEALKREKASLEKMLDEED